MSKSEEPFEVRDQVRENEQSLPLTDCQRFGHVWVGPPHRYPTTARCAKCGVLSDAEEISAREERDAARDYLIRNVLRPLHPNIKPAPDLIGVCMQVDNVTAGLRDALNDALAGARRTATKPP